MKMPKKKIYDVSESAEQLIDMPKKEKNGRFRDRLRLLRFLKTGEAETMTRAADLCNVSRPAADERFRRCETGGITELLRLRTVPGRSRAVPAEVAECLKERLSGPEGFGSYGEPRTRIRENHHPEMPYETVHKTVRCYPGAGPETPRPSHIKKTENRHANSKSLFRKKYLNQLVTLI
jgi:hypothetical protein